MNDNGATVEDEIEEIGMECQDGNVGELIRQLGYLAHDAARFLRAGGKLGPGSHEGERLQRLFDLADEWTAREDMALASVLAHRHHHPDSEAAERRLVATTRSAPRPALEQALTTVRQLARRPG